LEFFSSYMDGYAKELIARGPIRRRRNLLGRAMGDFLGGRTGGNRYLVLGLGAGEAADLAVPDRRERLIAYGSLLSDDGTGWLGTAACSRLPTRTRHARY
jgi:hypothetical protein